MLQFAHELFRGVEVVRVDTGREAVDVVQDRVIRAPAETV